MGRTAYAQWDEPHIEHYAVHHIALWSSRQHRTAVANLLVVHGVVRYQLAENSQMVHNVDRLSLRFF